MGAAVIANVITGLIVACIVIGAITFIYKSKKRGVKCIGCSSSGSCSSCGGACHCNVGDNQKAK